MVNDSDEGKNIPKEHADTKDYLPDLGRLFMMDFIFSIELFLASSAPGGRVATVPVVWASSPHPPTRQTEASAVGRIRLPLQNDVVFERTGHLSIQFKRGFRSRAGDIEEQGQREASIPGSWIGPGSRRARAVRRLQGSDDRWPAVPSS
jgi:hypothetical protein